MKQIKKLITCLLVSALALTAVGCGGEEKEDASGAAETIGAGAEESAEQNASGEDAGKETAEGESEIDFAFIDEWIVSAADDKSEITLVIAHHIKEAKNVEFTYQEVLLDGAAAENWEAHGRGADTFTIDPNAFQSFPQTLILGTNIDNYSELTIHATANFDDGTEPFPFSVTYQVSELERKTEEEDIEEKEAAPKEVYVEKQELYNDNDVVITVLGIKAEGESDIILAFDLTNNGTSAAGLGFKSLYLDGELQDVYVMQGGGGGSMPGETSEVDFIITADNEEVNERIRKEEPEISLVLSIGSPDRPPIETPQLTFPVILK